MSIQTIPEFFATKSILITGATGFLGKVLLEKLLRSCPGIESIYLIIKSKHGKDPQSRVKDIITSPLFDVIKAQKPGFENKIIAMEGNVSQLRLGLSKEDYEVLIEKINVVFHVAASVQFTDPLYAPIKTNTRGTREVVELCLKMKSLKVLLYVSTAYSNCNKDEIEEIVYPQHIDWKDAIEVCEKVDPVVLNILQDKYLGDLPNTYVLSKNMAEHVIWDNIHQLPVVIFRPSIVVGAWQEPFPGWVDSVNGLTGIILAQSAGLLHAILSDGNTAADYVPVDLAVKTMIVAVWRRAVLSSQKTSNIVYNCASMIPSLTNDELTEIGLQISNEHPVNKVAWYPGKVIMTTSKTSYRIRHLIQHMLPALLVDTVLKITGSKPRVVKIQRKIYQTILALSYFASKSWTFKTENFAALNEQILAEDKENFYNDLSSYDKETYARDLVFGVRKHLLHDSTENVTKARQKISRIYWAEKLMHTVILGLVLWMINLPAWMRYFGTTINSLNSLQTF